MENKNAIDTQGNQAESTAGYFFMKYEEYVRSGNNEDVTVFLQKLLQEENGISHEASQQIVNVINASVDEIEKLHKEWYDSSMRLDEIIEKAVKQTTEEVGCQEQDVYAVMGTLSAKSEVEQLSLASGEVVELAEDFKVDTEDRAIIQNLARANQRTTEFQLGNTAQAILDGAEEKQQMEISETFKKAVETELFSQAETMAKQILAAEIYSAVAKKKQDLQPDQKSFLPVAAAAEAAKGVVAAKAAHQMNETPDEDARKREDLKRYAETGTVAAVKTAASSACAAVCGYGFALGAAAFTLVTGIVVPPEFAYRAGKMVGHFVAHHNKPVKKAIHAMAESSRSVAKKAIDYIANVGGKRVVDSLHAVGSAVEQGVKKVKEAAVAAVDTVKRGVKKLTSWLFG